ncbi:hypothetical protein BKA62DRAFT_785592 [Auriculariales sp. MPI-PUGE-AT-0066]|nr:hypothetical protein BKA62DRAFT_785592 [Auriculariales sp. MPI-PUGE-AT-0066]
MDCARRREMVILDFVVQEREPSASTFSTTSIPSVTYPSVRQGLRVKKWKWAGTGLAENDVLGGEPIREKGGDEKTGSRWCSCRRWSSRGDPSCSIRINDVTRLGLLTGKLLAVDVLAAGAVVVERGAGVAVTVLADTQLAEVARRLAYNVVVQLEANHSGRLAVDLDLELLNDIGVSWSGQGWRYSVVRDRKLKGGVMNAQKCGCGGISVTIESEIDNAVR